MAAGSSASSAANSKSSGAARHASPARTQEPKVSGKDASSGEPEQDPTGGAAIQSTASTTPPGGRSVKRTSMRKVAAAASGSQAVVTAICARSGAGIAAARSSSTVTLNAAVAEPPGFLAVTATVAPEIGASVGIETTPVPASIVAPAPATAKRRSRPAKTWAVDTSWAPVPWSKTSSKSVPVTTGAGMSAR